MRFVLAVVACCGAAIQSVQAQETRAESRPDPATEVVAAIDARLYGAERAGLEALTFTYRPASTGPLDIATFKVRVSWSKGEKERIDYVGLGGEALTELPEILRQPAPAAGGPSVRESFEQGAKSLLAVFRGTTYTEQFRNWRKRLELKTVNGREERTIVCEPYTAGYLSRVEIALDRKDLPWRIVSVLSRPEPGLDRMIDEPTWTEFDGKLLSTGFKKTRGSMTEQIVINYQRKDGFIVPASYERLVPGKPATKFVFDDVALTRG